MSRATTAVTLTLLMLAVIGLQALHDQRAPRGLPPGVSGHILYVQSGEFMKRAALSYDSLLADVYWIRAVQHFGGTKLSTDPGKQYDLLYPLLDLTTSLDPQFNIAYRFGAIFLAETPPGGPGRPDQAIELLEKGLKARPGTWELAEDIGFVHYWWLHDYPRAAEWFTRAGAMPGAPNWLAPLAAVTLAEGGNRESSRRLWQEVLANADADWLKTQARFRLSQLDALDQIEALANLVRTYQQRTGARPRTWVDLVRAGYLRGLPIDSERHLFQLDPETGAVTLSPSSPLNPLPAPERPPA